jgi:hypothetical protein
MSFITDRFWGVYVFVADVESAKLAAQAQMSEFRQGFRENF